MSLVAVRECTSAADVMANAREVSRLRQMQRAPRPVAVKQPEPVTVIRFLEQHNAHMLDWREHRICQLEEQVGKYEAEFMREGGIPGQRPIVGDFIRALCRRYEVSYNDIVGPLRIKSVTFPRHKMVWLIRQLYSDKLSFPMIGQKFGGRDHTTALNSVKVIDAMLAAGDPSVSELSGLVSDCSNIWENCATV